MGMNPSEYRYKHEGDMCLFMFTSTSPKLKGDLNRMMKSESTLVAKDPDVKTQLLRRLFGDNALTGTDMQQEIETIEVEKERCAKFLGNIPSQGAKESSAEIAIEKLTKAQRNMFKVVQESFHEEGKTIYMNIK